MFPLFQIRAALGYWVAHYCDAEFERCRRHQSLCAGEPPNTYMLPNGKVLGAVRVPPRHWVS